MKIGIFSFFLFLFLACKILESLYEPLRYLKYALPFLAFVLYFFVDSAKLDYNYFSYLNTFFIFYLLVVVYLLIKVLSLGEFQERFIPNASFILLPLLFIYSISPFFKEKNIKEYVKVIFFVSIFIFIWLDGENVFLVVTNLGLLKEAVLSSTIITECALAYAMGLFLFYFITEKYPKKYIIASAVMFVLCYKRIAIGGFIIAYLCYYLSTNIFKIWIEKYKMIFVLIGVGANLAFIKLVSLIVNGDLDKIIYQYTGISANHLLMGRKTLYSIPMDHVGGMSWSGIGLGKVDMLLLEAFGEKHPLHSDILNNYLEFGVILFIIWLVLLFYKTSFSNKAFSLLIYFNIMMFTDNVFIYFDFMFYFYLFILIYIFQTLPKQKTAV